MSGFIARDLSAFMRCCAWCHVTPIQCARCHSSHNRPAPGCEVLSRRSPEARGKLLDNTSQPGRLLAWDEWHRISPPALSRFPFVRNLLAYLVTGCIKGSQTPWAMKNRQVSIAIFIDFHLRFYVMTTLLLLGYL